MSKYELRAETYKYSGITYDQSQKALELSPSIYNRLQQDGIHKLSQLFYNLVFDTTNKDDQWFRNIFASSTKQEAVDNQYRFLVQTFGGPELYKEKKGKYTRLVGRHAAYNISHQAANRWMQFMSEALNQHELLKNDTVAREALEDYFRFQAHYIVVASVFMKSDQLSGGTSLDPGRIW